MNTEQAEPTTITMNAAQAKAIGCFLVARAYADDRPIQLHVSQTDNGEVTATLLLQDDAPWGPLDVVDSFSTF